MQYERKSNRRRIVAALVLSLVCGLSAAPAALAQDAAATPKTPADVTSSAPKTPTVAAEAPTAGAIAVPGAIPMSSLLDIFVKGGMLMYPIAACSFVLLAFVFERAIMLRRGRVIPNPFVKRFLHQLREGQLDRERALELCQESKSPIAEVFANTVRKWGRPVVEVEQAVLDGGERVVNNLRRHLRIINGIASVSPLLGLLGTVTGMIAAFNALSVSQAVHRSDLLAAGVSEALLTTAAGLVVAIPALIFHTYFVGRVDRLTMDIDSLGQELVHLISAESVVQPPKPKSPKQKAGASAA